MCSAPGDILAIQLGVQSARVDALPSKPLCSQAAAACGTTAPVTDVSPSLVCCGNRMVFLFLGNVYSGF